LLISVIDVEPLNSPALFSLSRCYDRVWRLTGSEHFRAAAGQARARAKAADPRTDEQRRDALRLRAVTAQRTIEIRSIEPIAPSESVPPADQETATSDPMAEDPQSGEIGAASSPVEAAGQSGRGGALARLVALVRQLRR
jgi:hypothetical protein